MEIRFAGPDDMAQIKRLWEYCFDDPPEFVNWFFSRRYKDQNTLAVYEGGSIRCALQLLPYKIMLRDQPLKTSYLVGLSTWPQYRGRGNARALIRHALEIMRMRQEWVSILLPFRYDFYRKHGWEICYHHLMYRGGREMLGPAGKILEDIIPADKGQIHLMNMCYQKFMKAYNGYVMRNEDDWDRWLDDLYIAGGTGYIAVKDSQAIGYVLFEISNRQCKVRELIYTSPEAQKALMRLIANHYSQIDSIVWNAPPDDISYMDMPDPRGMMYKQPYVMGRIVDVGQALRILKPLREVELNIQVIDPLLEWNNGVFSLRNAGGAMEVSSSDASPQAVIPVTTLAQLLWGYITPAQAKKQGKLDVNDQRAMDHLETIFTPAVNYIIEDY
ncbi:MAG: GNAT family N-acetyltransferase [Clostridia bacterium]